MSGTLYDYQDAAEHVRYDPDSGILYWKDGKRPKGRTHKTIAGRLSADGYVYVSFNYKRVLGHRLAWFIIHGCLPEQIDHKNLIRSDNSIKNLRVANHALNLANKPIDKRSKTGVKGVHYNRKWDHYSAKIGINKVMIHLGLFKTAEEASRAYVEAATSWYGEYARWSNQ